MSRALAVAEHRRAFPQSEISFSRDLGWRAVVFEDCSRTSISCQGGSPKGLWMPLMRLPYRALVSTPSTVNMERAPLEDPCVEGQQWVHEQETHPYSNRNKNSKSQRNSNSNRHSNSNGVRNSSTSRSNILTPSRQFSTSHYSLEQPSSLPLHQEELLRHAHLSPGCSCSLQGPRTLLSKGL